MRTALHGWKNPGTCGGAAASPQLAEPPQPARGTTPPRLQAPDAALRLFANAQCHGPHGMLRSLCTGVIWAFERGISGGRMKTQQNGGAQACSATRGPQIRAVAVIRGTRGVSWPSAVACSGWHMVLFASRNVPALWTVRGGRRCWDSVVSLTASGLLCPRARSVRSLTLSGAAARPQAPLVRSITCSLCEQQRWWLQAEATAAVGRRWRTQEPLRPQQA